MSDALKAIARDFEAALLDGVRSSLNEAGLIKIRDETFDKLRELKEAMRAEGQLDAFFAPAAEIMTKFDMVKRAIGK